MIYVQQVQHEASIVTKEGLFSPQDEKNTYDVRSAKKEFPRTANAQDCNRALKYGIKGRRSWVWANFAEPGRQLSCVLTTSKDDFEKK